MNAYEQIRELQEENGKNKIDENSKVAVLFVNSYLNKQFCLGEDTCNDGVLCAEKFKELGYQVYVYFDVSVLLFVGLLKGFINKKLEKLVIYFTGHGMSVHDRNGDEKDGKDEALVFKDGCVLDDDLKTLIDEYNVNEKLILLTDCCHSGSIFDINDNPKITTFSAAFDNETAKQARINRKGNGVFTYYLWKYYGGCENNLYKLRDMMNKKLEKFKQKCNCNHDLNELF